MPKQWRAWCGRGGLGQAGSGRRGFGHAWLGAIACVLVAGCVRLDASHCGNLAGDATCAGRDDGATPYCSTCTATNDGCVEQPVEPACVPTNTDTTTSATTTVSSEDPTVSSEETSLTATTTTTETTTVDDTGTTETTDTSTGTTTGGPQCGDGVREGTEQCDGNDFDGQTCAALPEFSEGMLSCNASCMLDTSLCEPCVPSLGTCELGEQCCSEACGSVVAGLCE